jgi:putative flippase GtrA
MAAAGSSRTPFVRHQAASVAATLVDFSTMVLLVEAGGLDPALATFAGASFGAVVNFALNRRFTFESTDETMGAQALRYASVSLASAGLNGGGVRLAEHAIAVPYFILRILVAVVVSVGWNYPMHRSFVFRSEERVR